MTQRKVFILCLLIMGIGGFSYAQSTGTIIGTVNDIRFNQPLPGANVLIENSSIGTSTDTDGRFILKNVPSGAQTVQVSYLGFVNSTITVSVEADATVEIEVVLEDNFLELDGITVQGLRQGQASALNQQKTAVNIKNVVASDLIGRFPDQNVADALRRVPAISIQQDQGESRYIQIRGTNPNLSNVSINGEQIANPEWDVRFAALDMIPSDVLGSIEVNKAITPDMDGDAIGGSVNLKTLGAPNRQILKVTLAPGYNNQVQDLSAFGGLGSLTYGNRTKDGKLGYIGSVSYNRSNRASNNNEMEYDEGEVDELQLRDYELTRERLGFVTSLDYMFSPQSRVFFNSSFNYFSDLEFRRRLTLASDKIERDVKDRLEKQKIFSASLGGEHSISQSMTIDYMASYSYADQNTPYDRSIAFAQEFEDVNEDAIDIVEFSRANRDYPQFSITPEGQTEGAGAYAYNQFEFDEFEESSQLTTDEHFSLRANITQNYSIGDISGKLQFGGLIRNKQKTNDPIVRKYGYDGDDLTWAAVESTFEDDDFLDGEYAGGIGRLPDPEKVDDFFENNRANFEAEEEDNRADTDVETFDATEDTYAGYVMTELRQGSLSGLIGARYEFTSMDYDGFVVDFNEDGDLLPTQNANGTNDYSFFLPMLHITYQVSPLINIRAAWTNSFAKPNYFDIAPYRLINREDEEIELGNPSLDATTSMNFDLLGEYYFNSVGIISAGIFYKQISDFIYFSQFEFAETGPYNGYDATQPVNGGNADLAGFELNLQQQLTFLPGFASGFGVYANYTYSWSEAEIILEEGTNRMVSLPGQAENTANFALSYERSGFSGRVSMSYAGSFIDEIRDASSNDRIYDEHLQIDFSASQRVNNNMSVFLELINLTNEPLRYYNGVSSRPEQQEFYSFWGNLGVKLEF